MSLQALAIVAAAPMLASAATPRPAEAPTPSVVVTVPTEENARLRVSAMTTLRILDRSLRGRLCLPLHPATRPVVPLAAGCVRADDQKAIVHLLMTKDGALHRFFSTHPSSFEQPTQLGSITKALVALPALARAGASEGEVWCADADAGDVCPSHLRIPARRAFAKSHNEALVWRLRRVPSRDLLGAIRAARLRAPADYAPELAIAFGVLDTSPRAAVEGFLALTTGRARRVAITRDSRASASALAEDAARAMESPARRAYIRTMLLAPAEAGGTAAFLTKRLPAGAGALSAKTGTPTAIGGAPTGKVTVASWRVGRHQYGLLVAVLSPLPSLPLSPGGLRHDDFLPLFDVLLRSTES